MGAIVSIIVAGFTRLAGWFGVALASSASRFLVLKAMLLFLFVTILPVVLNNVIYSLLNTFMTKAASASTGFNAGTSPVLALQGLGAYLASQLGLPEAMSIILSAVAIGATLRILKLN